MKDQTSQIKAAPSTREVNPGQAESSPGSLKVVPRLNLLFPLSAILSFLFVMTAMVVANPVSSELEGPFITLMQNNGMWILAVEVIAIVASGVGAMWIESRTTKADSSRFDNHSENTSLDSKETRDVSP